MVKAFILAYRRQTSVKIFIDDLKKVTRTPKRKLPPIPLKWNKERKFTS